MNAQHWLVKSEPDAYSWQKFTADKKAVWDGVRNFTARNNLRAMKKGDLVLFYHSNADPPAVVGTARVVRAGYPDPTQFDAGDSHHDPASATDDPRWFAVDIAFDTKFAHAVTLPELRADPAVADMVLLRKGSRLSVQPVSAAEWKRIAKLGAHG